MSTALRLRINIARRAVRELVAIAEQRVARQQATDRRFRPLTESETEALIEPDLLARLAAGGRHPQISQ